MHDQVERGVELGLAEICFTEHLDCDPDDYSLRQARPGEPRDGFLDSKYYNDQIMTTRYSFQNRINLLKGVEIGEAHRFPDIAKHLLEASDYDLVVASVHQLFGFDLSIPWTRVPSTEKIAYDEYFQQVLHLVQICDLDVLAHLDVVKRCGTAFYGRFDAYRYRDILYEILTTLVRRGKGLEINTSGYRQAAAEPYPALQVLQWYKELGGEIITIGSDSHHPSRLGSSLDDARELAIQAGFKAFATYKTRNLSMQDF
ncbi:MAG: histidinol-phosphatase HisJ family protein [Symbiobacteriaceae bacterium]|nr:histidinol-phosphatase HisJ family protein [Symbiobacteriaceae bacterium]